MSNILFFLLMFTWLVYVVQETFISGSSALNTVISKDEGERKQIQVATGLHWDGVEVWLIVAMALTFAAFPTAFGTIFEFLYVPIFLLLYTLITRGIAIEVLYKLDNEKWVKAMKHAWSISSILILFIVGIYLANIFVGFPYDGSSMTSSFLSILNVTTISAGLFFVASGFVAGAAWISFTTSGQLGDKALHFIKKTGVIYSVPVFLMITLMGLNNLDTSIFAGTLFTDYPVLFVLPAFGFLSGVGVIVAGIFKQGKLLFLFSLLGIGLFVVTGFVGTFPYVVPSSIAFVNGIDIVQATVGVNSLRVILITISVFYPIVIGYQTWKYITFGKKVHYNDELEV